jgi:hypothetical protein
VGIVGITAIIDRVRRLFGHDEEDEMREVVFLVGPPRSALDIADELEREQAAAKAAQESND